VFKTDDLSRTVLAYTDDYRPAPGNRSPYTQAQIGHLGGGEYQGGHLIADSRGAGGEKIGTVPMLTKLNQGGGEFWNIEDYLNQVWKADPKSNIKFQVDALYTGSSQVPDSFIVTYSISGGDPIALVLSNV
jgi:hypothetical protein